MLGRAIVAALAFIGGTALSIWFDRLNVPTWLLAISWVLSFGVAAVIAFWPRWKAAWSSFWQSSDEAPDLPNRDELKPVDVVEDARKKRIRSEVGGHLSRLYHDTACHALGDVLGEASDMVQMLRQRGHILTADLLLQYSLQTRGTFQPLLDAQRCDTDAMFNRFVIVWSEVFLRYQNLVGYVSEARTMLGLLAWDREGYGKWREYDEKFIAAMKDAEHMAGCEAIAYNIKHVGWGEKYREPPPTKDAAK